MSAACQAAPVFCCAPLQAHHIFAHCLRGLMARKAVVLITHQVEFLPQCHKVCASAAIM